MLELALGGDGVIHVFLLEHEEDGDAREVQHLLRDGEVGFRVERWCCAG
jgi:hypothetical protein